MRVLLLRLLISWWVIPLFLIVSVPLACLMFRDISDVYKFHSEVVSDMWNGFNGEFGSGTKK